MRLIDVDAFVDTMGSHIGNTIIGKTLIGLLNNAPTIDAKPVRYGVWVLNKHHGDYECSLCKKGDITALHFKEIGMHYCPNCGAKMDAEVE